MNGIRVTHFHNLSSHASVIPMRVAFGGGDPRSCFTRESAYSWQQTSGIPCLDYHGRRGSGETGADFLDFLPRPTSGLTVCMGAAQSPATDSELMLSGLENLLFGLASQPDARPASIVQALNLSLCGAHVDSCYAALFYAAVDPLRRQLSYVNAGHEPALLLRKRQNRAIFLESTGAILGLTSRSSYGQRSIPLEPGDLLAVFSESVAESVDMLGRPFGAAGVLSVIRRASDHRAAQLVEEILDATERHAGWSLPPTDRTAAVVRFTGSAGEANPARAEAEAELAFAAA